MKSYLGYNLNKFCVSSVLFCFGHLLDLSVNIYFFKKERELVILILTLMKVHQKRLSPYGKSSRSM